MPEVTNRPAGTGGVMPGTAVAIKPPAGSDVQTVSAGGIVGLGGGPTVDNFDRVVPAGYEVVSSGGGGNVETFTRTVASGLGVAEVPAGNTWAPGASNSFSVNGTQAVFQRGTEQNWVSIAPNHAGTLDIQFKVRWERDPGASVGGLGFWGSCYFLLSTPGGSGANPFLAPYVFVQFRFEDASLTGVADSFRVTLHRHNGSSQSSQTIGQTNPATEWHYVRLLYDPATDTVRAKKWKDGSAEPDWQVGQVGGTLNSGFPDVWPSWSMVVAGTGTGEMQPGVRMYMEEYRLLPDPPVEACWNPTGGWGTGPIGPWEFPDRELWTPGKHLFRVDGDCAIGQVGGDEPFRDCVSGGLFNGIIGLKFTQCEWPIELLFDWVIESDWEAGTVNESYGGPPPDTYDGDYFEWWWALEQSGYEFFDQFNNFGQRAYNEVLMQHYVFQDPSGPFDENPSIPYYIAAEESGVDTELPASGSITEEFYPNQEYLIRAWNYQPFRVRAQVNQDMRCYWKMWMANEPEPADWRGQFTRPATETTFSDAGFGHLFVWPIRYNYASRLQRMKLCRLEFVSGLCGGIAMQGSGAWPATSQIGSLSG